MTFKKYPKIYRLGKEETDGILCGLSKIKKTKCKDCGVCFTPVVNFQGFKTTRCKKCLAKKKYEDQKRYNKKSKARQGYHQKLDDIDRYFSKYVRTRDQWTCVRCGKRYKYNAWWLGCSHFFGRRHMATRFNLHNCDSLCNYPCHHLWGGEDREEYKRFKVGQLGEAGFRALELLAHSTRRINREYELDKWKTLLKDIRNGQES